MITLELCEFQIVTKHLAQNKIPDDTSVYDQIKA